MAMGTMILIASGFAAVNVLLLLALGTVWVRNYRTFQTPLILGLLAFAGVLLIENALALYFFFSMTMLYSGDPTVQTAVAVLRALQFVAIAILTYITMK